MKIRFASLGLRALKDESGQVFAVTGLGALLLVGLAGISIEVGHGYYALELLQASTDEATIAAASGLPSATQANTNAQNYSSETSAENSLNILQNIGLTVSPFCSTTVSTNLNVPCQAASGSTSTYNAVRVVQTATTGLWIGRMFGTPLFNLEAIGTAAMAGGNYTPYNIAVVMDSTGSMGDTDSTGQCSGTQETCALAGLRVLLQDAYPCGAGQTCTASGNTPDDAVALFTFPTITAATIANDTSCSTSDPSVISYTLPTHPGTEYYSDTTPTGDTYEVVPFIGTSLTNGGSSYKSSDTASALRTGDPLVNAAGGPTDNCVGLRTPGGAHTYYAQAIYEAGAALAAEQTARPGTNNIMIILTDGNATASMVYDATVVNKVSTITGVDPSSDLIPTTTGTSASSLNGTKVAKWSAQANTYTYPSAVGECGQAVKAAYDVANSLTATFNPGSTGSVTYTLNNSLSNLTKVYTIGYGSPNTWAGDTTGGGGNCASDQTYSSSNNQPACTATTCTPTVTTGGGVWPTASGTGESAITAYSPCAAIAAMASSPNYFFSDDSNGCKATTVPNAGITSLTQVFGKIINSLSSPKLLPLGTT